MFSIYVVVLIGFELEILCQNNGKIQLASIEIFRYILIVQHKY